MKDGEPDAVLEISPLLATSAQQLRARKPADLVQVKPGQSFVVG